MERLADADDSAATPAGVASTNLRFLDDGGVGMWPCGRGTAGGTVMVLHLDHGGGGGTCWVTIFIGRSEPKPFRGGED